MFYEMQCDIKLNIANIGKNYDKCDVTSTYV